MRFHVLGLPHTNTTSAFPACAYTQKVIGFCRMMMDRGHEVFLYAGEQNEAPCTEHIPCISERDRAKAVEGKHYTAAEFSLTARHWQIFNGRAMAEIAARKQPHDFLCLIAGRAQEPVAHAYGAEMIPVEFGIGYGGTFSKFRVFESYAWMHVHYGATAPERGNANSADGNHALDAVIPGYLDPAEFPFYKKREDYYLFVGRLGAGKGEEIAIRTCREIGARLLIAGPGVPPAVTDAEYLGVLGAKERNEYMARAQALFLPTTQYIEPFGNVVIEAAACGTPALTTDWGAFPETVVQGVTGFRCRSLKEFILGALKAPRLDHEAIRRRVLQTYSLKVVGQQYEEYFLRIAQQWGDGYMTLPTAAEMAAAKGARAAAGGSKAPAKARKARG